MFQDWRNSTRRKRTEKLIALSTHQNESMEDILSVAKKLGKKIVHVNRLIHWLSKNKKREYESHIINESQFPMKSGHPFILLEDLEGTFKPLVKEFLPDKYNNSSIPCIHIDNDTPLLSPFLTSEEARSAWRQKEEKQECREGKDKAMKKGGWCECCSIKYSNLEEHLGTLKHQQFGMNDDNYQEIDAFIHFISTPSINERSLNLKVS